MHIAGRERIINLWGEVVRFVNYQDEGINMKNKTISFIVICLLAVAVAGCGGKKGGNSQSSKAKAQTEVSGKAKAQSEVRGKSERPETRQEKLQKQYKKDSERLEKLHKEYRELLLKVTNTPDPRERERISDRMDRINREAEELQSKMYRLYGRMY